MRSRSGEYNALRISIIKNDKGVVDSCVIGFETIWGYQQITNTMSIPHLWKAGANLCWYKWMPTEQDIKKIREAIKQYVVLWR